MPDDTLFFTFNVSDSIIRGEYDALVLNQCYGLTISVRYTDDYDYLQMPIHLIIDGVGQYVIQLMPKRPKTWGGMMQEEFEISGIPLFFAVTGKHQILAYPDTVLTGICSIGIDIR